MDTSPIEKLDSEELEPCRLLLDCFSVEDSESVGRYSLNSKEEAYWLIGAERCDFRGNENVIFGKAGTLSRRHAKIESREGRFYLNDLQTRNGTYLARDSELIVLHGNGVRLADKDVIGAGDLIIAVSVTNDPAWSAKPLHGKGKQQFLNMIKAISWNIGKQQSARSTIRLMIEELLSNESDLDGFLIDYFFDIKKRMSMGMERKQKINLLLELADPNEILVRLHNLHD